MSSMIYLTPLLKKITFENKKIFLTGDFNINLLNTETDEPTSSFLNNLASNLFIPHIILPTRITTTIMFINYLENCENRYCSAFPQAM